MTERMAIACCWLLLMALLAARPVLAELQGSLALSGQDFDYEETDTESPQCDYSTCDTEDGVIPGLWIGLRWQRPDRFVETDLTVHAGWVDYWSPRGTSETHERILDWNLRAGLPLAQYSRTRLDGYAGVGYRDWRRSISSSDQVGPLEKYRWPYLQLGVRAQRTLGQQSRLGVDVRLLQPLDPDLEVDFRGEYDKTSFDPGSRPGFRLALEFERDLDRGMTLWLSPWYEYWELDASPRVDLTVQGAPTPSQAHEPDSETRSAGLTAGARWRF